MSKIRQQYDEDFRKNVVKLSYATSKTIPLSTGGKKDVWLLSHRPALLIPEINPHLIPVLSGTGVLI